MSRSIWTIYDIAREAKVSAKTVSRVLNGKGGVGEDTRERILEIMRRVDYHPNIGARALRAKQNACIGVTVPAPLNVVPVSQRLFLWLFTELFRIFGAKGEYLCFDMNPYIAKPNPDYARGLLEQLYKACVVVGPLAVNDISIKRIHESGIPYMAFGRLDGLPECSSATVDYEKGAYISTKFLLERGHKRIAMLKAFSGFQPGEERLRGYHRALAEAGIEADERLIRSVSFGAKNIANMVHRMLAHSDVTALIDSSGTEDATSLREGMRRAGRKPGKDCEVVAWTYAENMAVLSEAAAHVWLPVREAAAEGLEQLAAWVNGSDQGPIKIVYAPILTETRFHEEIPAPQRLFDLLG